MDPETLAQTLAELRSLARTLAGVRSPVTLQVAQALQVATTITVLTDLVERAQALTAQAQTLTEVAEALVVPPLEDFYEP